VNDAAVQQSWLSDKGNEFLSKHPLAPRFTFCHKQYGLSSLGTKRCRYVFLILTLRPRVLIWFSQNLPAVWKRCRNDVLACYRHKNTGSCWRQEEHSKIVPVLQKVPFPGSCINAIKQEYLTSVSSLVQMWWLSVPLLCSLNSFVPYYLAVCKSAWLL